MSPISWFDGQLIHYVIENQNWHLIRNNSKF